MFYVWYSTRFGDLFVESKEGREGGRYQSYVGLVSGSTTVFVFASPDNLRFGVRVGFIFRRGIEVEKIFSNSWL